MGTVGAIRDRDVRGRFTSRPSPYQGTRPGADVYGPTGLSMDTAQAAMPGSRKYANSFPTNYNINYARMVPSASQGKVKRMVKEIGEIGRDVHHKGFVSFVVRDWRHIDANHFDESKQVNTRVSPNYGHVSELVSLAALNATLYAQQKALNKKKSGKMLMPEHVVAAVNFDGIVRNEVGEQLEDVYMHPVESGSAQASVFNNTVRGRVPAQNIWGKHVKGNQMLYLTIRMVNMKDDDYDALTRNGYRTDPNGMATGGVEPITCVQVVPWCAKEGHDRPPDFHDLCHTTTTHGPICGYYIAVGRCSDRKRYSMSNEAASRSAWFDARYAIISPMIEIHVETCSPPITYGLGVLKDQARAKSQSIPSKIGQRVLMA